jgi:hypothetical protein
MPSFSWVGDAVRTSSRGDEYTTLKYSAGGVKFVVRVGDVALLESDKKDSLPFVGVVVKLWETKRGVMSAQVRWMYRVEDFESPSLLPAGSAREELFLSTHADVNNVSAIVGVVRLDFPDAGFAVGPAGGTVSVRDAGPARTFICRRCKCVVVVRLQCMHACAALPASCVVVCHTHVYCSRLCRVSLVQRTIPRLKRFPLSKRRRCRCSVTCARSSPHLVQQWALAVRLAPCRRSLCRHVPVTPIAAATPSQRPLLP